MEPHSRLAFAVLFLSLARPAFAQSGAARLEFKPPADLQFLAQTEAPQSPLPSPIKAAKLPPPSAKSPAESFCQIRRDGVAILQASVAGAVSPNPANPMVSPSIESSPCAPLTPIIDWYARFLNGPQVKPLSPKEKGLLAIRNLMNPFNGATIAGNSAIFVAFNSHSPYGPGMPGFARNVGVSFTEDMTAEFFGTFVIPSIVHEDPHYHRMPSATIRRRILHAIISVGWAQGDNGKGMINYSELVGYAIDGAIANLYVPGQQTDVPATVSRYAIGIGLAPIDNFITEFLPTIASHIHTRAVFVQSIINQVARSENTGP